jgi:hypothetical protein
MHKHTHEAAQAQGHVSISSKQKVVYFVTKEAAGLLQFPLACSDPAGVALLLMD